MDPPKPDPPAEEARADNGDGTGLQPSTSAGPAPAEEHAVHLERPSLFRPSTNAWMKTSGNAGLQRTSVSGFKAQLFNESLARMSQTPGGGWREDDTAELVEVSPGARTTCRHVRCDPTGRYRTWRRRASHAVMP